MRKTIFCDESSLACSGFDEQQEVTSTTLNRGSEEMWRVPILQHQYGGDGATALARAIRAQVSYGPRILNMLGELRALKEQFLADGQDTDDLDMMLLGAIGITRTMVDKVLDEVA